MAGVLVAFMFLLLLCILFTLFMCRREKQRSRSASPRSSPPQQKADHQLAAAAASVWSTQASARPSVVRFPTGGGGGGPSGGRRRLRHGDGMTESLCDSEESGSGGNSFEQSRGQEPRRLGVRPRAGDGDVSLNVSPVSSTARHRAEEEDDGEGDVLNYSAGVRPHHHSFPTAHSAVATTTPPQILLTTQSLSSSATTTGSSSPSASNASFETERSIGEAADRSSGSCVILHPAPSLHETHFGLGPEEDPLTILHPPRSGGGRRPSDLRWANTASSSVASVALVDPGASSRKISCTKSEGRAALVAAQQQQLQQLPLSSYYYLPGSRPASTLGLVPGDGRNQLPQRLSTPTCPGSLLSTAAASASSVFQCQHDCFLFEHQEEHQSMDAAHVGDQLEAVVQQITQEFYPEPGHSDNQQNSHA